MLISGNLLWLFDLILLLDSDPFFFENRFSGLLLSSHLVNLSGHFIELFVEDLDNFFLIVLVDEVNETIDDGIT